MALINIAAATNIKIILMSFLGRHITGADSHFIA
jgi:hypothetical protein